jgi:hypothetical protein
MSTSSSTTVTTLAQVGSGDVDVARQDGADALVDVGGDGKFERQHLFR